MARKKARKKDQSFEEEFRALMTKHNARQVLFFCADAEGGLVSYHMGTDLGLVLMTMKVLREDENIGAALHTAVHADEMRS